MRCGVQAAFAGGRERNAAQEGAQLFRRFVQALERVPFVAGANVHGGAEGFHLGGRHQAGMVVLVAGERQAGALDRVGDEADRPVVIDRVECLDDGAQIVTAEIAHQPRQFVVAAGIDQPGNGSLIADLVGQALAPGGAALEYQRRVKLVRAAIDPAPQHLAARLGEGGLLQRAVFEHHHVPAEIAEQIFVALPQPFAHHRVEALPVVVDDPPAIANALLPALEQRLEDIAFVELGVAEQRDHAAFRAIEAPAVRADIILHQRGKQRLRHAQAHRTGREIDVVAVLGARRIGLRAFVAAEVFQLLAGLASQQILDRVIDRRGVRLDGYAIGRPQGVEVKRDHDRGDRGGRGLMAADFQSVGIVAQMVGVMDGPACEPQHLALELIENLQVCRRDRVSHCDLLPAASTKRMPSA